MKSKNHCGIFFVFGLMLIVITSVSCRAGAAPPDLRVKASAAVTVEYKGQQYAIINGGAYKLKNGLDPEFVKQIYDPEFYLKHYETAESKIYRKAPDGSRYPVLLSLNEGFENAGGIRDLIGPSRGWTSMTLLAPSVPTVKKYVQLRNQILRGERDFIDNRIEPSSSLVRSGKRALHLRAVAPSASMLITKASLDTELLHFKKGDDIWFSGWYYISQGRPIGLLDFESSFIDEGPGMRLLLSDDLQPRLELKWGDKPTLHSEKGATIPVGRWFNLRLHLTLSDQKDGRAELWIDSKRVINSAGQTLPLPDAVYDRMQVGITANPKGVVTDMFVDDVVLSREAIP